MAHSHHGHGRSSSSSGNITAFERDVKLFLDDAADMARKAMDEAFEREQRKVVDEALRSSGIEPLVRVFVDGRMVYEGRPFGYQLQHRHGSVVKHVYMEWSYLREVAVFAEAVLRATAPMDSGNYLRKIMMFVDGKRISSLSQIPFDCEIMVIPTADYSRRLEIGKKRNGRPFIVSAPYQMVEGLTKGVIEPKFRAVANVQFNYADINNPYILKGSMIGKSYKNNKGRMRKRAAWADRTAGQAVRYPAIVIRSRG